ncbi:nuclear transport factor 2 family protein [Nocardia zapadnayensis]|uniref:nuclear transport factor 2 family protein n=1 Tax=Nocardia rhamnosiphila TaxID=426716 RepID=UPI0022455477|nr:nuclear transport factor 2 family protein [Nocardia zapadnayensis]MCX0273405.1 nuclear transport factor 2 family protein [Nocardia zapadnayensis]
MSGSPSPEADPAQRLTVLEAIEAIKALKHRYFRACDAKDPVRFRACFVTEGAVLDYGELGVSDADGMAAVFESIALRRVDGKHVVLDMHHGMHPDITVHADGTASGQWTMQFRQVNLLDHTDTLSTGEYEDSYALEDGRWKIAASRFRRLWSITRPVDDTCRIGWYAAS